MSTGITLRRVRPDEAEFLYETRRSAFRAYAEQTFGRWDEVGQHARAIADVGALNIEIVEQAGTRIGYQLVEHFEDHWFLDQIALVEAARGRRIGTGLVTTLMAAARAAGVPLRLSVLEVNPAQRLYARLGFRVTRIEPPRIKMEWP